jgi:RimJ/RimL family protein N-acetyltransferase
MSDLDHFCAPERIDLPDFTLRAYAPGDGPALTDAVITSHEHLRTWLAWSVPEQTVEQSEDLVRSFAAGYLTNRDFTIGVWSPDGARLLGGTGFHLRGRPVGDQVAEIGMWIRADASGRGLGTAVLRAMLRWGFTDWPWERLAWHCDERNTASARTAERAGMRREGALRGDKPEVGEGRRTTLIYGLTRADPLTC